MEHGKRHNSYTSSEKQNVFCGRSRLWLNRFIKENIGLAYTTIGGLCSALLGAFFWFIIASILDVNDYGLLNYYIALASIFAALGTIGLDTTITTYLAKGEEEILYEANFLTFISGLLSALILSAFHWGSGLLSAATIFFTMTLAEMLGRRMYREYAILRIGQRLVQIILSILLYFQIGILGIILGYFLGYLSLSYKYFRSATKFSLKINNLKEKYNFTLHSYGFNLIGSLSNYLDKIVIGTFFGYRTLGLYQLGFQFFMLLNIIPGSLYRYLLPEESSGKSKTKIKMAGLALAVVASLLLYILTPYLIEKLFPTFIDSIQIIQIMSLAVIPSTAVAILTATLIGREKSKNAFISGLVYLASLIIGLIAMGRVMGNLGLALTLVIAHAIQAIYLDANK